MTVRKYGKPPFDVAVLHGGPGAPGYMAPVARELSHHRGILEPIQSRSTLESQIVELKEQLAQYADPPVTLIGSSWGAVLALFVAAREPSLAKKLVLIGSAVFDAKSSASIEGRRLQRLDKGKRRRYEEIVAQMQSSSGDKIDDLFNEWGEIIFEADVFDPITRDLEILQVQAGLFKRVWSEFVSVRDTPGRLERDFSGITIPVVVIHGEYDPHPIEGIRPYLESWLHDVDFHVLAECGHYPWIERKARTEFFDLLRKTIQ
jgi:pimeloyl-ACP methyl ester carboxylesterase